MPPKKRGRPAGTKNKKVANALGVNQKKAVAMIARRVLNGRLEHKYKVQGIQDFLGLKYSNIYAVNPMGLITFGTDNASRIGDIINNLTLRVKLGYVHLGQKVNTTYQHLWNKSSLRVMVIKTKRQLTNVNGVWTDITSLVGRTDSAANRDACMFYQPDGWVYPYHSVISDINKDNDFKVVYDRVITSKNDNPYVNDTRYTTGIPPNPVFIPNGNFAPLKFKVKLGKFEYEEANIAYAKKGVYNNYIMITPFTPLTEAGVDLAGDITCHYSLSWTDA